MKVAQSKNTNQQPRLVPPIPLKRESEKQYQKNEILTISLRTQPDVADSPTFNLTVPYFNTGTATEAIEARENIQKIFVGQGLTTGPQQFAMVRRVLKGDALAAFNAKAAELPQESVNNCTQSLDHVIANAFPKNALPNQKKFMRKFMRKPADMGIRMYCARVVELNALLTKFPPNFNADQRLPADELLDAITDSLPKIFRDELKRQNFDPYNDDHNMDKLREICECVEEIQGTDWKPSANKIESKNKDNKGKENTNKQGKRKFCHYHGYGGHISSECENLKAIREGRKNPDREDRSPEDKQSYKKARFANKTWQRNKDDERKSFKTKNEINVADFFNSEKFTKAVENGVMQVLKKRKQSDGPSNIQDLDNFNFDRLNVSEDSDIEEVET